MKEMVKFIQQIKLIIPNLAQKKKIKPKTKALSSTIYINKNVIILIKVFKS